MQLNNNYNYKDYEEIIKEKIIEFYKLYIYLYEKYSKDGE